MRLSLNKLSCGTRFLRKAERMSGVVTQTLPLELLDAGERGVISEVHGRSDLVVRLEEMGLHRGVRIRMIQPGSPCIVEINDQRFSIRFEDCALVLVDVEQ